MLELYNLTSNEGGTHGSIWHQDPAFRVLSPRVSSRRFWRYTRTPVSSSHTYSKRLDTKIRSTVCVCIFDLCAGCIHYRGGFVVKAPWRKRYLENYEFHGNSPEGVGALLYMRQVGGGLDSWLSFFLRMMKAINTENTMLTLRYISISVKSQCMLDMSTDLQGPCVTYTS